MKTTHKRKVQIARGFQQRVMKLGFGRCPLFDNPIWDRRKAQVAARHSNRNFGEHLRASNKRARRQMMAAGQGTGDGR